MLLLAGRLGLARFVDSLAHAGRLQRRAVVVGGGDLGAEVLRGLQTADPAELRILGVFDDRADARSPDFVDNFRSSARSTISSTFARRTRLDLVIFALPISAEQRILQMLRKLWVLPIDIRLSAHANSSAFGRAPIPISARAGARHPRQADRRLGPRDQMGLRQGRRLARADRCCRRCSS